MDLKALGPNAPAYVHLVMEAMKVAFADRERYYGDPPSLGREERRLIKAF